jgi:enoyl-CoA hydratase/carnithine racemase
MTMSLSSYETLILEQRGNVGWLIFNRPEAMNSHNLTMLEELPRAWKELENDDDVRVVVITGRGRAFCTGADVKEITAYGSMGDRIAQLKRDPADEASGERTGVGPRTNNVWKPVIAAVNGVCAGGGLNQVAECDIALASSNATFVDTHVSVGQVAALEPISLYGRVPFGELMRFALVGRHERMSAQRAWEIGMISEVVDPPEELEDRAQALAEKIARNSPSALIASKRAVWYAREMGRADALAAGMEIVEGFWDHPDNREGPAAFAAKREPNWAPPTQSF